MPLRTGVAAERAPRARVSLMIIRYIEQALRRAHYEQVEDGAFCATVRDLWGVIATGRTLEDSRDQFAEVIEGRVLARIADGLAIPKIGGVTAEARMAS